MKAGKFVSGIFKALPSEQYLSPQAMSVHNQVYEIRATVQPIPAAMESEVVSSLMAMNVPGCRVLAAEAEGSAVRLQVVANQFEWAALFAVLPSIIGPIGLLIIGLILAWKIPDWAWAAIPLGVGGGIFIYALTKAKEPKPKAKRRK